MRNLRAVAAETILAVMDKGASLSDALPKAQQSVAPKDQALLQEICFGVIRLFPKFDALANQLVTKRLKGKQRVFHHLIIVGLYQLEAMRIPSHAAVAETVSAASALKAKGLKGLINGCLRNFQRNREALITKTKNTATELNHPNWFINLVRDAYPEQWQDILQENLQRAPMWLRVHTSNVSADQFCDALKENEIGFTQPLSDPNSILLEKPKPVTAIPGFDEGWFAVQDAAAQQAARLLDPQNGEEILDACAAPGGKTCHILDLAQANVTAVDIDDARLARIDENMARLKVSAELISADLTDKQLFENKIFDRILLDAPCSATGVIRRHPDIKWLRREEDIAQLALIQQQILQNLWRRLKPGGTLLYATCSILPAENKDLIRAFLAETSEAKLLPINENETVENPGWQILPGEHNMDGFYYCRILKQQ